jgi:hypothetical protein
MLDRPFTSTFEGSERALATIAAARSREVPVRLWRRAQLCGIANLQRETRASARLGDVLDHIEGRSRMFEDTDEDEDVSIWTPAAAIVPELIEQVPAPAELPAPHFAQLWIGGRGQATSLHEDPWPNFNFQLAGEKRFILFPPEDAWCLYRSAERPGEFDVDPLAPDETSYPDFQRARQQTFTLCAGQFIYIPETWPHQVEYLGALAINLSWWGRHAPRSHHSQAT